MCLRVVVMAVVVVVVVGIDRARNLDDYDLNEGKVQYASLKIGINVSRRRLTRPPCCVFWVPPLLCPLFATISLQHLSYLHQEGAIALHLAVERYDPGRGVRFFTYADWSLRAAFEKAVSQSCLIFVLHV